MKTAALKLGSTALAPLMKTQVLSQPARVSSIVGTGGTGMPFTKRIIGGFSADSVWQSVPFMTCPEAYLSLSGQYPNISSAT